jgi:hypothetical protein
MISWAGRKSEQKPSSVFPAPQVAVKADVLKEPRDGGCVSQSDSGFQPLMVTMPSARMPLPQFPPSLCRSNPEVYREAILL